MEFKIDRKICLGISACMFGAKVRYNGKGWDMLGELKREKGSFQWVPICPEVMSGLGVPRNPISLSGGTGFDFWKGDARIKDRQGKNLSEMIKEGCEDGSKILQRSHVDAYIFMEGSPTCGVYRTSLKGKRLGNPPGVFGAKLLDEGYFLIPAQDLASPIKWWDWRRRLTAFVWLKNLTLTSNKEIYEMWHILKFLCQELDEPFARKLGNNFAELKRELPLEEIELIRTEILTLLRKPTEVEKIKHWLWKNYSYLKKHFDINIPEVQDVAELRSGTHIAQELLKVEIQSRKDNLLFGSSPIIYKF